MKGIDLNRYIEILDPQLEFVIRNLLTYKKEKIFFFKHLYQKVVPCITGTQILDKIQIFKWHG